jgi:hypothetical protein
VCFVSLDPVKTLSEMYNLQQPPPIFTELEMETQLAVYYLLVHHESGNDANQADETRRAAALLAELKTTFGAKACAMLVVRDEPEKDSGLQQLFVFYCCFFGVFFARFWLLAANCLFAKRSCHLNTQSQTILQLKMPIQHHHRLPATTTNNNSRSSSSKRNARATAISGVDVRRRLQRRLYRAATMAVVVVLVQLDYSNRGLRPTRFVRCRIVVVVYFGKPIFFYLVYVVTL